MDTKELRNNMRCMRLMYRLKLPFPHVAGLLMSLHDLAEYKKEMGSCGEIVVGSEEDVEIAAGWTGEPGVLFEALLNCGGPDEKGFIFGRSGMYFFNCEWAGENNG